MARAHHPSVQGQRAQLDLARAHSTQAVAGFLPGLTGSFAYSPQTANFAATPGFKRVLARPATSGLDTVVDTAGNSIMVSCSPPGGACAAIPPTSATTPADYTMFDFWTAGVGLSWTLFDWGRTWFAWRGAQKNVESQKLGVGSTERNVVLDVKLAFFGAVAADAQTGVAEEAIKTQQRHAEQARAFFQVGTRTKIDVASADSDLASAELTLARAHAIRESARAQLALALGEDVWRDWELVVDPRDFELAPDDDRRAADAEQQLSADAVGRRTEARELQLRADSYQDLARSARGSYLPALTLQLGPSWAGTDIGALTTNFQATLAITYPAFGGMNPVFIHGNVREAEANRLALVAQGRATKNALRQELVTARAQLVTSREALVAAAKLVGAATERRTLAEGRYQAGVGGIIELSDAQLGYVNARFQQVQAGLDVAQARARLQHALGED
ncbi:MAG: outer rane efflux protein [Myxococcales bacterium]|nr:outer rane efflux protein [Myxococcales bacterium]